MVLNISDKTSYLYKNKSSKYYVQFTTIITGQSIYSKVQSVRPFVCCMHLSFESLSLNNSRTIYDQYIHEDLESTENLKNTLI